MPSSATITSFYNFAANTKARASQMSNNFDVFRGHIIPVHVSTATSANNTYDLGSYEYRWANLYAYDLELGSTSTNAATINIDTATTTAELVFKLNGTEKVRINTNGLNRNNLNLLLTSTSHFNTSVNGNLAGSTLTFSNLNTSKPVSFNFINDTSTINGILQLGTSGTTTVSNITFSIRRDGTIVHQLQRLNVSSSGEIYPIGSLNGVDLNPTTNPSYYINVTGSAGAFINISGRFIAYQI